MNSEAPGNQPIKSGLWSVLWRSLVLFPWMLIVFVTVTSITLSLVILPVYAALHFYLHDWLTGTISTVGWFLAFWIYRRFKLGRYFEAPDSVL